jgi:GxxExxY protein
MKRTCSFRCSKSPQKVMYKSVELKALTQLEDEHLAQAMNYPEAYNVEIGLLINFDT